MKPLMRVFILAGAVALTTTLGSVEGEQGDLLVAEPNAQPVKLTVQANSSFALRLYQQLAKDHQGKNLFFSPYSISTALAMTAEGARGETAEQMGKVLGFPAAARRTGDDAQQLPWQTSLIHTGLAQLYSRFNAKGDSPERTKIRAELAELRRRLETQRQETEALDKSVPPFDVDLPRKKRLERERLVEAYQRSWQRLEELARQVEEKARLVDQYELAVANALWGEETVPFASDFVATINKHYDVGGLFPVDFRQHHEQARAEINSWVEDQTRKRIRDLLPPGSLDERTRLVLANAIYFKGEWESPFSPELTDDEDFWLADGRTVKTSMMCDPSLEAASYAAFNADGSYFKTPLRIRENEDRSKFYPQKNGFKMVELPYKGDALSMVVIAPNDPAGLPAIEAALTTEKLNTWIGRLEKREMRLFLPKFKGETDYDLRETLQHMGMVRAFVDPLNNKQGAEFQGLIASTKPEDQLFLSLIQHKAFIEVNEKGTEAVAVTALPLAEEKVEDIPFTPEFKADRPFIYLIRDKATGSILFMGRMVAPS